MSITVITTLYIKMPKQLEKKLVKDEIIEKLQEIDWRYIKTFKLPIPSLPKKREIAEIIQTIDQKIEIEQKKNVLYKELFKATFDKLMKGEINLEKLTID